MPTGQELQVQEKRELEKKAEQTVPVSTFLPATDIYETDDALTVVMGMPGVDQSHLEIGLENDVLSVMGRIELGKYENLQPVYTEYMSGTTTGPSTSRRAASTRTGSRPL